MHRVLRSAHGACAAALLLAHCVVIAAAGSPAFHEWLHGGSNNPHHECAATVYTGGQLDHPVVPLIAIPPATIPAQFVFAPADSFREISRPAGFRERAPPAA